MAAEDPTLAALTALYDGLDRLGPGSDAATRRALAGLPGLPARPRAVDFGCGTGASSLVLAAAGAEVVAVDRFAVFLRTLARRAAAAGLADRIRPVAADMAAPPLREGAFDLVWSEGAIYLVGFAEGLARWRPLLRPGGCLVATEVTWLTDDPPAEARAFWQAAYPPMTTIEANTRTLEAAGFRALEPQVLPASAWADYYAPLEARLPAFRAANADDPAALAVAEETEREIAFWRAHGTAWSYVAYCAVAG